MKYLKKKEIRKFAKKYLSEKIDDIQEVSLLKYGFVKEYLANHKYLVVVKPFKVTKKTI